MINWGIIGAGRIAHRFANALANDNTSCLYATSNRTMEKAKQFQTLHHSKIAYDSFDAIINDENIEAIYIALPHYYHYEYIKKALLANKKVLVEKPATISLAQMEEVAKLAKDKQVLLMEAMKTRFVPAYQKLNQLIDDGIIGEIKEIKTNFCYPGEYDPNSYLYDQKQGGCLFDLGIYNIGYIADFIEDDLKNVIVTSKKHPCGVETYLNAKLEFNTSTAIIECAMDRQGTNDLIIIGSKGTIKLTPIHRPLDLKIKLNDGTNQTIHLNYLIDDFYGEIAHFNRLIIDGRYESPIMPLSQSIKCAKILAKIKEKL